MKTEIKNITGCSRIIKVEVESLELNSEFDHVYADIRKVSRVPGFRPGKAPRDLLETHYGKRAREEVIKRAIPEYYLKAVKEQGLIPVAAPEIENVQLKDHALCFSAKVDIKPQVKIKSYKNLKLIKKKTKIEQSQVDEVLETLRQSKAKKVVQSQEKEKAGLLLELNDQFAKDLGFKTLQELKDAINKDLQLNSEIEVRADLEKQLIEQLLKRASLDAPDSLVNRQTQELVNQLKMNRVIQGEKKDELESKQKELDVEARKEAVSRVKSSFILEEIAEQENIQVEQKDLDRRIAEIAQRSGKSEDEIRQYLDRQNLIPGLKAELRERKVIEFLLSEAKVEEGR